MNNIKPRTPEERIASHGGKKFPWQKFGADFHSATDGHVYMTWLYGTKRAAKRDAHRTLEGALSQSHIEVFDRRTGETVWTSKDCQNAR